EAQAYELLLDRYALTQQEVADRVGKERATVANICRLLTLNKDVQEMVKEGQVSLGHAKALLSVADSKTQRKLALKVAKQKVSVRQLERLIKRGEEDVADASSPAGIDVSKKLVQSISEELQKRLGTKVEIDYHNQKGKISVHFYSDEELTSITDRMKAAWNR
ncbi:MAG: chromosome partitioning protein, partial [Bdellovibrionales bacterium]|nr:chromosome partitioning protein [Bdellovibrionales bacterium]